MAQVKLSIGGRSYELACREGEEAHYETLAARIDAKAQAVTSAVGGVSETRMLLLTALLLADDIHARDGGAPVASAPTEDPRLINVLEGLAHRLEALGTRLENAGDHA